MKMKHILAGILLVFLVFSGSAYASFSNIVAYGDSLSDNGDGNGRYTDDWGFIWLEYLQFASGAELYDYAVGGATTSGVVSQVASSGIAEKTSDFIDDSLFTVWAGANDITNYISVQDAIGNIKSVLDTLIGLGADTLLVLNLPDLGNTPLIQSYGQAVSSALSAVTVSFNEVLATLVSGYSDSIDIYLLDIYSLFNEYTVGSDSWLNLFWEDGYHPSNAGHAAVNQAAVKILSTPLPGSVLLLISGLVCVVGFRRKQTA